MHSPRPRSSMNAAADLQNSPFEPTPLRASSAFLRRTASRPSIMARHQSSLLYAAFGAALLSSCGGSGSSGGAGGGTASSDLSLVRVSNGFGELLPHKAFRLDGQGNVTGQLVALRSQEDILANVVVGNPIQPVPVFDASTTLPSGVSGNHFMYATFTKPLDVLSLLSSAPGLITQNSMTGALVVTALDPVSGNVSVVRGRGFVNGQTMGTSPTGSPPALPLESWVELDSTGAIVALDVNGETPGVGFPGTEGSFSGQNELISPNTFVFVVDSDGDLSTHESFPTGAQIRMEINTSVLSTEGRPLSQRAVASTTVGPDTLAPELVFTPPPNAIPAITPGGGESNVDPLTTVRVQFTEPMQPWTVGDLFSNAVPGLSASVTVRFGPTTSQVSVPFHASPASPYDLTTWDLYPAFNFPGDGPTDSQCGTFNRVDVDVSSGQAADISGNVNQQPGTTFFVTGEGPGLVNVPVTPDAIYLGQTQGSPGISVVDLNGFGQGTGNPTYDQAHPIVEGNSNYPNNPNVRFQGSALIPALTPGTCTIDGGSSGVFSLAKDSSLNDQVVRTPVVLSVGDMMLGWALDVVFNNGPSPFGCQGGGGNICATNGLKQVVTAINGNALTPASLNPNGVQIIIDGNANMVSWSPHPNPPPLLYPPLCVSPFIGGQEPTSINTLAIGASNLLQPGDAFGDPSIEAPPSGTLGIVGNLFFQGPSPPQQQVTACLSYGIRQQVGHFLYVIDRARSEVLVLNSNRMTVIDRIEVADPTTLALGTNLDLLAVTNQSVGTVTFIDVNPSSSTFHEIIKITSVGENPRGIAWEPGNEDILVCNEGSNSLSIISAFSLEVRKTVTSSLNHPFEVCITPRQSNIGLRRNVYFAYILNRNGRVAVFESGPNGVNGWGYDNVVGTVSMTFRNPKTIQPDHNDLRSGFWVVHEGPLSQETEQLIGGETEGALTNIVATSGIPGQIILNVTSLQIPQLRDIDYQVKLSIGEERLTGVPVDIAFDNQVNLGGVPNWFIVGRSAGSQIPVNGKGLARFPTAANGQAANRPRFAFASVPNPTLGEGGVDVILLDGAFLRFDTNVFQEGVQSIVAPDTTVLMDYFRQ